MTRLAPTFAFGVLGAGAVSLVQQKDSRPQLLTEEPDATERSGRRAQYCRVYPSLCKAGCMDEITSEEMDQWRAGRISTDGHVNAKPWCNNMAKASTYAKCWDQDLTAYVKDFVKDYKRLSELGEDDGGYCYHSGHCDEKDVLLQTTVEEAEHICTKRYGDKWHSTPPKYVETLWQKDAPLFRSKGEADRQSSLKCLTGTYHCDVLACQATYCLNSTYKERHAHPVKKKTPATADEETKTVQEMAEEHDAKHKHLTGFWTLTEFDGWNANCYDRFEKELCTLNCRSDPPLEYELGLWRTQSLATPAGHANPRTLCLVQMERKKYIYAGIAKLDADKSGSAPDQESARLKHAHAYGEMYVHIKTMSNSSYEESTLNDLVNFCVSQELCTAKPLPSIEAGEEFCDAKYSREEWTGVSLKSDATREDYPKLIGKTSCAMGTIKMDIDLCQELVCWNTFARCDSEFCEGHTENAPANAKIIDS